MRRSRSREGIVAAVLALGGLGLAGDERRPALDLPPPLAGYRAWPAGAIHAVSAQLSLLCVALPEKELERRREEARRAHGPHAERHVRVFANPTAFAAARDSGAQAFPAGSIIAKEKLGDPQATKAEAVAFMIKHASGTFPESGDWEFRYFPETRGASTTGCVECHRAGASRDYVFGRLHPVAP